MVTPEGLSTPTQVVNQGNLIRATLIGPLVKHMVTGPFLVAFAVQVLHLSNGQISTMLTVLPLFVVLRYPLLDSIRAHPRQSISIRSRCIQLICLLALLLLPVQWITLPVLIGIAVLFVYANEFLQNAVWLSLVAEVSARRDRGHFFGRLRTTKDATSLAFALFGFFYVGDVLDRGEHRVLVLVVIALVLNSIFWLRRIPAVPPPDDLRAFSGRGKFLQTLRTSPLMRRPLALVLLNGILDWPILMVYLVGVLNMPANLLMLNVVASMLGPIFSVFLWGKSADALGERRIFRIYYSGALILYPMLLLVPDFDAVGDGSRDWWFGLCALLAFNFLKGILDAGRMMADSMLQARYVGSSEGFHAINIQTMCTQLFAAAMTAVGGLLLAVTADMSAGAIRYGAIWLDPFRVITIGVVTAAILAGLAVSAKIRDD